MVGILLTLLVSTLTANVLSSSILQLWHDCLSNVFFSAVDTGHKEWLSSI